MSKQSYLKRILAVVMAVTMLMALCVPAGAVFDDTTDGTRNVRFEEVDKSEVSVDTLADAETPEEPEPLYADTDNVRVSIVLDKASTIEAGYSTNGIAHNAAASAYRADLRSAQEAVAKDISRTVLGGAALDVAWNLTLAANIISANVKYGSIEKIKAVEGVKDVVLEVRYEPNTAEEAAEPQMLSSSGMIGSADAWAVGYTGAGSRLAIIDTGVDSDHQSFSSDAFDYSLAQNAAAKEMEVADYVASLDLLDASEVADKLPQLNISSLVNNAASLYLGSKIPFAFNYVDEDLDVTHDNDEQGEHGSHVTGIAAANAYIETSDNVFKSAATEVGTLGVAPDAQIITMKVFGKGGGAYDSDYMVAIEDAIVLGCDSVNLSLGSGNNGFTFSPVYQELLDSLSDTDTVVVMSIGNNSNWGANTAYAGNSLLANKYGAGYLQVEDTNLATGGSPGTYTNSLAVASVDNDGSTGPYFTVGNLDIGYAESSGYGNESFSTLNTASEGATEYDYVYLDGNFGADGNGLSTLPEGIDYEGKIVFVFRGGSSFFQKANAVAEAGAAACIVVNNEAGVINMNLTGYTYDKPCVSILQTDGAAILAASTAIEGVDDAYSGKLSVPKGVKTSYYDSDYYTLSDFSSWGPGGDLSIKPEITAPGGNIYSVNGLGASTDKYESMSGTSMAAPQVTGMVAVVAQYIREMGYDTATGASPRTIAQALLMGTAVPMLEAASGMPYSILAQGAGLANVGAAVSADSYLTVEGQPDGKVKAEFGDDPDRDGVYSYSFDINNLTDKEVAYTVGTFPFTQDAFLDNITDDEMGIYLDTWTAWFPTATSYQIDGKPLYSDYVQDYDFDGDGTITANDAQAILDYVAGNIPTLSNTDHADISGDDAIGTEDAQMLLDLLESSVINVPANGSVTVDVTIALTNGAKEYFDDYYVNGAYVEGYTSLTPVPTEEGVIGVEQSIPFLGFYGSWSEASMYDRNEFVDSCHGVYDGYNYINDTENFFTVSYAGDAGSYYYVGNPYGTDDEYLPVRNAFNSETTTLDSVVYTLIRNAVGGRFFVVDSDTGEEYFLGNLGTKYAAFYYENGGVWQNTSTSYKPGWDGTDASGDTLAEGTNITFGVVSAPEYYLDSEGHIDFDALDSGAYLTMSAVIDNTAPMANEIALSLSDGKTMYVSAADNNYIAAIVLMNADGSHAYSSTPVNQTVAGENQIIPIDLSYVEGRELLIAVCDYACNESYYRVYLDETPAYQGHYNAFNGENWITFDAPVDGDESAFGPDLAVIRCAEYANGYVFFCIGGELYAMQPGCYYDASFVASLDFAPLSLAFDAVNNKLLALNDDNAIYEIDLLSGSAADTGVTVDQGTKYIAYREGTLFGAGPGMNLKNYDSLDTLDPIGTGLGLPIDTVTGFTYDAEADELVFIAADSTDGGSIYVLTYDVVNDTYASIGTLSTSAKALYCVNDNGKTLATVDTATGIMVSTAELDLLKGQTVALTANLTPWLLSDKSISWTSDDTDVVTVTDGLVKAVGAGNATITVASVATPTVKEEIPVTVSVLDVTVTGALQDEVGAAISFTWDLNYDSWATAADLAVSSVLCAMTDADGNAWVMDDDSYLLHKVDPATGEILATLPNADGIDSSDMADAPVMGGFLHLYGSWILSGDYTDGVSATGYNLGGTMAVYTGAENFVSIAHIGSDAYSDSFLVLDDAGYLWALTVYTYDDPATTSEAEEGIYLDNIFESGLGSIDNLSYNSLCLGEDGNLYMMRYTGDTSEFLILMPYESASILLGDVGADVWPAVLWTVESNTTTTPDAFELPASGEPIAVFGADMMTTVTPATQAAGGSTNDAPNSAVSRNDKDTFTTSDSVIDLSADEESYNGLYKVTYDADALTFDCADSSIEYNAVNSLVSGTVYFAYAGTEPIDADAVAASLHFLWNADSDATSSDIIVELLELDEVDYDAGANTQTLTVERKFFFSEAGDPDAEYEADPCADFTDLDRSASYHDAIDFMVANGLMVGTGETTFSPDDAVSRAMAVAVLYRVAGCPAVDENAAPLAFTDVPEDAYFYNAVRWAVQNGVVYGVSETEFAPNEPVTRQQLVTFLWRYCGNPATTATLDAFEDADQVSDYARIPMAWAADVGLVCGVTATQLAPIGNALRYQFAFIIYRAHMYL